MDQSTFNHGKSGDTNPKGRSRSPLLELYTRSLRNEREEKIGHRTSAACGGRLRLCYTLDEGKESERETTNCPPKRVRSSCLSQSLSLLAASRRGWFGLATLSANRRQDQLTVDPAFVGQCVFVAVRYPRPAG